MQNRDNERYSRQTLFAPLGKAGQQRLLESHAVIVGCGALGSGIAHNLARAGVGRLRIVDRDRIELSNLARQVLYREEDVRQGLPKAVAATRLLAEINSEIALEPIVIEVDAGNVDSVVEGADVVVDGSDNMKLRFILNDACVRRRIPWVYGGALASWGMTMTILPGRSPCLRCVLEEEPPPGVVKTANDMGVLNTITGLVSAIESNEAMKILAGAGEANPDLLRIDVWTLTFRRSAIRRRVDCPTCGDKALELQTRRSQEQ